MSHKLIWLWVKKMPPGPQVLVYFSFYQLGFFGYPVCLTQKLICLERRQHAEKFFGRFPPLENFLVEGLGPPQSQQLLSWWQCVFLLGIQGQEAEDHCFTVGKALR